MALRSIYSDKKYLTGIELSLGKDYLCRRKKDEGLRKCLFSCGRSSSDVHSNLLYRIPDSAYDMHGNEKESFYLDLFTIDTVKDTVEDTVEDAVCRDQKVWIPLNEYPLYDDYGLRLIAKFTRSKDSAELEFGIYDWLVAPNGQVYLRHPDGIYTKLIILDKNTQKDILSHDSTASLEVKERAINDHMEKLYGDRIANKLCVKGDDSIKANGSDEEKKKIKEEINREIVSKMMYYEVRLKSMKFASHLLKFTPLIACALLVLGIVPWNYWKLNDDSGSYALAFLCLGQFILFVAAAGVAALTISSLSILFDILLNRMSPDQAFMMRTRPAGLDERDINDTVTEVMARHNGKVKQMRNDLSSIFWGAQSNLGSGGKKNSGKKEKAKEILKIAIFCTVNVAISIGAVASVIVFAIKVMNNRSRIFEFRQSEAWIMFSINSFCVCVAVGILGFGAIALAFGLPAFVHEAKSAIKEAEIDDKNVINDNSEGHDNEAFADETALLLRSHEEQLNEEETTIKKLLLPSYEKQLNEEELNIKKLAIKELATTELNIQTYNQREVPSAATTEEVEASIDGSSSSIYSSNSATTQAPC